VLAGNGDALGMTPTELCVLFSADVISCLLIWFTNFSERGGAAPPAVPQAKLQKIPAPAARESVREEHAWNVTSFFGLKSA